MSVLFYIRYICKKNMESAVLRTGSEEVKLISEIPNIFFYSSID